MTQGYASNCEDLLLRAYIRDEGSALRWIRHGIEALPPEIRPTHFGETERIRKKPTSQFSDRATFERFLARHPDGFFLYGDRIMVHVCVFDEIPSEINWWASKTDLRFVQHAHTILEVFGAHGALYGCGGDYAEMKARNQIGVRISGGLATGFYGRDFRRYIPGLYWLNYFSDEYLRKMPIDLDTVAARLKGRLWSTSHGRILRLYDQPADWRSREQLVGDVIHETPNVFSIRDIEIPPALDDIEYDHWSDKVFQQWP